MTYRDPYVDNESRVVERERTVVRDEPDDDVVVERGPYGPSPFALVRRIVWLLFGILQTLLVIRIVLLLLGANEGNDIVSFILGVTDPFVAPFRGMFQLDSVSGASGSVLDIAALVALVAWTLIEALVLAVIGLADRREVAA